MKNLILFVTLLFSLNIALAQSSADVGKIALSVVMPENVDGLDASQLSKLETKISQIVTASGLAASGYNNNFVIYPKFALYDVNVVEGGMQNIMVANCELSLFIKQVDNNVLFATISRQLKGSGNSKETAITNAISKIPVGDKEFKTFIEEGKGKIITYYESKCADIITKSESLVKMQKYDEALGLLMTVPAEVACYNKVQEKSIEAYKAYQNQKCAQQMQVAKTNLAARDNKGALDILAQIDPSTSCFKEAQSMINVAASKVDAEEKKQFDLKMRVYNDEVALEKQRVNAVRDIAVAYYKSQPTTVHYNYIVR